VVRQEKIHNPELSTEKQSFSYLNQLLVLFCLTGLAITEPVLTIFGSSPELFYFYKVEKGPLLIFYALTVAVFPAILILLILVFTSLWSKNLSGLFYKIALAVLSGLWAIQLFKWTIGIEGAEILAVTGIIFGVFFLFIYSKYPLVNTGLKIASVLPFVTVGVFLFSSKTGNLLQKSETAVSSSNTDADLSSVLFILLDEFPTMTILNEEGNLDEVRYPNLAQFSKQASWYRHHTILAGQTLHSVPSILTGQIPVSLTPSMDNFPENLFTLLAPTHDLVSFEAVTRLCGLPKCSEGLPGGSRKQSAPRMVDLFSTTISLWIQRISLTNSQGARLDDFKEEIIKKSETSDSEKTDLLRFFDPAYQVNIAQAKPVRLNRFVNTLVESEKPALYFIHLELPHYPFRFYPNGQIYDLPHTRRPYSGSNDDGGDWLARLTEHRFLLQAQYTDLLLEDIFSQLKSSGSWDDMLVVITADHGRSFKLNTDGRTMTPQTLDRIAYTPLMIKKPRQQKGNIDDSNLLAYDIVPTIADILGVNIPWSVDGLHAGHPEIALRGETKSYFPKKYPKRFVSDLGEKKLFHDSEYFPKYFSRRVGALQEGRDPLSILNQNLGSDEYFGLSPSEFEVKKGGLAKVEELDSLRELSAKKEPLGVVMGNLEFETSGDRVLVSINDQILTGSPLIEFSKVKNTFVAMLPQEALKQHNDIRIFLVEDKGLLELELH